MRKSELSSAIKTARDIMRKDAGLSTDVDRIPQLAWILFLKCFDDLEQRRLLLGGKYRDVIEAPYRWRDWAADEDRGRTGDELLDFVNGDLFPHLRGLTGTGEGDQRYVIAAIFSETYNRMLSGYLLRDVANLVDRINFNSSDDIPTNLLFFQRDGPTGEIWYYELPLPEGRKSYTKTKPLRDAEFDECRALWDERPVTEHSWRVPVGKVVANDYNLDLKNPASEDALVHRPPEELAASILEKEQRIAEIMVQIVQALKDPKGLQDL
jgi:type I restriction-modification system DNA methylase subunit